MTAMHAPRMARQASTGVIAGLSAVILKVSHALTRANKLLALCR
jgi:hypothetical protein